MPLDPATLFASVTISNLVGALIITSFAAGMRRLSAATRGSCMMWAAALALVGCGCLLVGLRGQISHGLSIIAANAMILAGHFLRPNALMLFFRRDLRLLGLPVVAMLGWIGLCQLPAFMDNLLLRMIYLQGALGLGLVLAIAIIWCHNRERLLTGSLLIATMALEIAAYGLFLHHHLGNSYASIQEFVRAPAINLYMITIMVCMVLTTILIPAMAIERQQLLSRADAWRDGLTGLLNRRAFEREARSILARLAACKQPHALLLFSLRGLDEAEQRFGPPLTQALLRLIGEVCRRESPDSALAARVSQREFAIFVPELSKSRAEELGRSVCRRFSTEIEGATARQIEVQAGCGVYWSWSSASPAVALDGAHGCLRQAHRDRTDVVTNVDLTVARSRRKPRLALLSGGKADAA